MSEKKFRAEIEIAGLPKTPNARMHWRAKSKENQKWRGTVAYLALAQRPTRPLEKAEVTFVRVSSMRPDFDNLAASFKACQDGLIDGGLIINDTFDIIGNPTYLWEKCGPKQGHIRIIVESVD